ncbi:MAG: D-sedoheptulose 7-phosphate isomerase [Elusimicrobia bacterium]|nr:D-sedoheptulose 7-phosphate isomerase [Elusimicrobiota bacterium]
MEKEIVKALMESSQTIQALKDQAALIARIAQLMIQTYEKGGKILVFGNGGSAADSQHFADELVGRFEKNRRPLPALALTTNTSDLTSISNDFGYELVFSRQLEAHAKPGDLVFGISTSGNSPNVLRALETAKELGLTRIGLTGKTGGKMRGLVEHCLCVPSTVVARIQESHITVLQILCGLVEDALFATAPKVH